MKLKTKMTHKAVFSSLEVETLSVILNFADAYVACRKYDDRYERAVEGLLQALDYLDDGEAKALHDVANVLANTTNPFDAEIS